MKAGPSHHDHRPPVLDTLVTQATWCAPTMGSFAGPAASMVPGKEGQIASSLG